MVGQGVIGSMPEFNSYVDDWNVYQERLEQFFEVNEIPPEKRTGVLITVIGDEYKTLRDLCHPALPKTRTFEDLCLLLRRQFSPQVAVYRERINFYNSRQEAGESVSGWYGRLKKLSVDCRFGETLEAILLDKFVTGLRNGMIMDRLCEENESLTLEQALELAVNKECALKSEDD